MRLGDFCAMLICEEAMLDKFHRRMQMNPGDYLSARAYMNMHLEKTQRWGEELVARQQTGLTPSGWLSRQRCHVLHRLGQVLVATGERLIHSSLPKPLPLEREMSRGN
jgi:hypothetical protein